MGYDLYLWPADRALAWPDALAELDRLEGGWRFGLGHDKRLDPFLKALRRRYPGIGEDPDGPPVEVDVHRRHVFLGIGWPMVEELVPVVSRLAYETGLVVVDPQREIVGLPSPMADAPLGPDGLDAHVQVAEQMLGAIVTGAASGAGVGEEAVERAVSEQLRAVGATMMSPLGFEITADIEAEVRANPAMVPASLQTPDWRDELVERLAAPNSPDRHRALLTLGGWGPDDRVARALRPLLDSEDIAEAGLAASALARQGDITDLPAVLNLVHRCSPADGGTVEAMLLPLEAALQLAATEGPAIVAGVKDRARGWRGTPRTRRRSWDGEADAALDALLAD